MFIKDFNNFIMHFKRESFKIRFKFFCLVRMLKNYEQNAFPIPCTGKNFFFFQLENIISPKHSIKIILISPFFVNISFQLLHFFNLRHQKTCENTILELNLFQLTKFATLFSFYQSKFKLSTFLILIIKEYQSMNEKIKLVSRILTILKSNWLKK